MLIERVIDFYLEIGKKHPGNPFRLSNSGICVRALAYQRFSSIFKSEPMPARVFSQRGSFVPPTEKPSAAWGVG
jgi:hypothetical protein